MEEGTRAERSTVLDGTSVSQERLKKSYYEHQRISDLAERWGADALRFATTVQNIPAIIFGVS